MKQERRRYSEQFKQDEAAVKANGLLPIAYYINYNYIQYKYATMTTLTIATVILALLGITSCHPCPKCYYTGDPNKELKKVCNADQYSSYKYSGAYVCYE